MLRFLPRPWQALAAGAALAAAQAAPAQYNRALIQPVSAPAPTAVAAAPAEPESYPGVEPDRLAEIRSELAWIADPGLCPFYPCARAAGGTLEVSGYVASEALRDHALQLARKFTRLEVVDRLQVHPKLGPRRTPVTPEQMARSAQQVLRTDFPAQASRLQVSCQPDGRVEVRGSVETLELKLRVSQSLRRLPGCVSVANALQVGAAPASVAAAPVAAAPLPRFEAPPTPPVPSVTGWAPTAPSAPPVTGWAPRPPAATPPAARPPAVTQTTFRPAAPAPRPAPKPAAGRPPLGEPYITEDMVSISGPSRDPAPPAKVAVPDAARSSPRQAAAALALVVRKNCPEARDVQVVFSAPGEVLVRLTASGQAEADRLAMRIRTLPELAPYRPAVEITVPR
jgi:hypothetical protein